jgi:hypothetical protein
MATQGARLEALEEEIEELKGYLFKYVVTPIQENRGEIKRKRRVAE